MQVRSLALLSGLRIWCCHKLLRRVQIQLGSGVAVAVAEASSCSSHLIPSLLYATGADVKRKKKSLRSWGVPAVAQWNQWYLWSSETQVQPPAWQSGLRIQCCHSRRNHGSDLIPGLGTPYAIIRPKKKKKRWGVR